MLVFPYAKINLGLNVVERRPDGYHELQSIMVPIPVKDDLEAIPDPALPEGEVLFTRTGLPVPGDPEGDLCMKAIRAVQAQRPLPGLRVHLHKVVPMGAGLGGGSSDGAHMLMLLDRLLGLGLSQEALHAMAAALGSDCPFFLHKGPQLAEGRGERLSPVALDLRGTHLLLVNPGIHVPTGEVFRHSVPTGRRLPFREIVEQGDRREWEALLPNTLEPYVLRSRPEVARVKAMLKDAGAWFAAMSGSGSTVFGLFAEQPPALAWPEGHRAWSFRL